MKLRHIPFLFLLPMGLFAQQEAQVRQLDDMIRKGMTDWQIPGLSVAVVKQGEVLFMRSYGVKDMDDKAPVNNETLFTMASTTKALVAIALGMLVDQEKLKWTDKVREHYPEFRLSDPYITEDARIQDLLTHNLGIGNADLLWVADSVSTDETIRRFALAPRQYPLRGGFVYQNIMYAITGEVITRVSGQHWTDFIDQNIFQPLEMSRSQSRSKNIFQAGNYAIPHYDDREDGLVKVDFTLSDQVGAAGMLWSSIADISKYLQFLTNSGVYKGDTLVTASTFDYLFQPHALVPENQFYPTQQLTKPDWRTYGLGWFQHDYRGEKLDFHTGSIAGLVAIAGLVREKGTAVYVFANLDHAELRHAIMYMALDLFAFGDANSDWHQEIFDLYEQRRQEQFEEMDKRMETRTADTSPSLALAEYSGKYCHEMLGCVEVETREDALKLRFNNYKLFTASHWHYDTFRTEKDPKWRNQMSLTFDIGTRGQIEQLQVWGQSFIRQNNQRP